VVENLAATQMLGESPLGFGHHLIPLRSWGHRPSSVPSQPMEPPPALSPAVQNLPTERFNALQARRRDCDGTGGTSSGIGRLILMFVGLIVVWAPSSAASWAVYSGRTDPAAHPYPHGRVCVAAESTKPTETC